MHHWEFNFDRDYAVNPETGLDECPVCLPETEVTYPEKVFDWRGAVYIKNTMSRSLEWKTKGRKTTRGMANDVHRVNMENLVRKFAAQEVGRSVASSFARSWMTRSAIMGTVACSCTMEVYNATQGELCFTSPYAADAKAMADALLVHISAQGVDTAGSDAIFLGRQRRELGLLDGKGPSDDLIAELAAAHAQQVKSDEHGSADGGRRRRLTAQSGALKAAVPQANAIGMLFAGTPLTLEIPLKGTVTLTGTAIAAADNKAEITFRSLPASVGNMKDKLGKCAGDVQSTSSKGWEVVKDACGNEDAVGMVASDALSINSPTRIRETSLLCISPRGDITVDTSKYPVADVVVDSGNGDLTAPLGATLTNDVSGSSAKCLYAQPGLSYILIYRKSSYESNAANCPPAPPPAPVVQCRDTLKNEEAAAESPMLTIIICASCGGCCLLAAMAWYIRRRRRRGSLKAKYVKRSQVAV